MLKKILIVIFVVGLAASGFLYSKRVQILEFLRNFSKEQIPIAVNFEDLNKPVINIGISAGTDLAKEVSEVKNAIKVAPIRDTSTVTSTLPDTINLAVPFTPQAPHANWEQPYQDACEEASVAMVNYFYLKKIFTPDAADKEILDIVAWEDKNFGSNRDTDAEQIADFIRRYYGYKKVEVIENPTVFAIKEQIAAGRPVILPMYGRALGNPYFTPPGPTYHMLVVKGYTKDKFITNDPGTRRGADYLYSFDVLLNANHDWNNGNVENGRKVMIVIYSN